MINEVEIDSIEELGRDEVWDISFLKDENFYLKEPNFIANNILVHNCHAAGIVISDIPLSEIAPLRTSNKGLATQFPYEDLESIGLIKFDILAISTLTVIQKTVEMIKENYGIDIDVKNLPLNDSKTFDLYKSGHLSGVFQCENKGMQETIQEIEADCFSDIMAAIALYRPGPMVSIPEYCARKKGLKNVEYFHPALEKHVKPYLKSTYGVAVFQEQIMQICNALAGFSVTDGYIMIKGIGKKKQHIIDKFKSQFIDGCGGNGLPAPLAEEYWEKFITPFASYGFNAAHAAGYGYLSYITAYLKANYTDEFMCSYLNVENHRKKHDKIKVLERDLKRFGIDLLEKNVNVCGTDYRIKRKKDLNSGIEKTEIIPSLMCKGVGVDAANELESKQPYKDLRDMAYRTDTDKVVQDTISSLVEDGFYDNTFKEINRKLKKGQKIKKDQFVQMMVDKFVSLRKDILKNKKRGIGPESLEGLF
ncbi:MAG: hypothetical protein ACOC5T_00910 [Elusimicrobiota bacterium]